MDEIVRRENQRGPAGFAFLTALASGATAIEAFDLAVAISDRQMAVEAAEAEAARAQWEAGLGNAEAQP